MHKRVLELAHSDQRVTAGALIGSSAADSADQWSDIDLTFGIAKGNKLESVLADWTETFSREFGVLHYWDLPSGPSIYRVFLLPSGLEIDVSVTPQPEFGARGPSFRLLFGEQQPQDNTQSQELQYRNHVGLGWHHVFHARSSIERGKPWRAETWIGGVRDETLSLAYLRLGFGKIAGRGIDQLPTSITEPLADTLVKSLEPPELRRALAAATECFCGELIAWGDGLGEKLSPILREFGSENLKKV